MDYVDIYYINLVCFKIAMIGMN